MKMKDPPSKEYIEKHPHVKKMEGTAYWETLKDQSDDLRKEMQKFIEEQVADSNENFVKEGQVLIKEKAKQLENRILDIISNTKYKIEGLTTLSVDEFSLTVPTVKFPDEDISQDTREETKKRTWKTLWLFKSVVQQGNVSLKYISFCLCF